MKSTKNFEENIRNAQTIEEVQRLYEEAMNVVKDPKEQRRIAQAYERAIFEFKRKQFESLKEELSKRKKKYRKQKIDVNVRVTKKTLKTNLTTAEHYVAMIQTSENGINILFLRKVKLEEQEGYLLLTNRKMKKTWVLTAEPILMEKNRFPWGRKLVALHFVTPGYPHTLSLEPDQKVKELALRSVNAPTIVHSLVKTKFFESLARAGGGLDYTMLIIGAVMGIGIGLAIGFGVGDSNLAHLIATHVTSTVSHVTNSTVTNTTRVPPPPSNSTRVTT